MLEFTPIHLQQNKSAQIVGDGAQIKIRSIPYLSQTSVGRTTDLTHCIVIDLIWDKIHI